MILENEEDLRHSYGHIVRMYELITMVEADTTGTAFGRECEIASIRAMIRKIERQIAAYYAAHPEHLAIRGPVLEDEIVLEPEVEPEPDLEREAEVARTSAPVT